MLDEVVRDDVGAADLAGDDDAVGRRQGLAGDPDRQGRACLRGLAEEQVDDLVGNPVADLVRMALGQRICS